MSKEKVYCKKCDYLMQEDPHDEWCTMVEPFKDSPGMIITNYGNYLKNNKNNDCPMYEPRRFPWALILRLLTRFGIIVIFLYCLLKILGGI